MAGPAPKTEKWTARENLHDYKEKADHLHLLVGGTVEVSDADKQPVLKQASGGGPKALTLDLSIEPCSDPAVSCAVWKAANFDTIVEADQYDSVDVRWDGKVIASTPVINDIEHGELLDKQSEAQDEVAAKETGTGAASVTETVKRVAKAIEDIAEGVGGIAEGFKKLTKAPKEVAKKAPPEKKEPPKKKEPSPKKKAPPKKTVKKSAKTAKPAAKKTAKKTTKKTTKKVVKKAMPKQKKTKRR